MCRSLVSVGYDGRLHDCDFNQMLDLPLGGKAQTIWEAADLTGFEGNPIETARHCFGCTAGAGSSCSGTLLNAKPARARGSEVVRTETGREPS
jgi:hypothetical protein